ncbi:TIGR03619 family F420-dependent LLM class oxidoreductase [Nocardia gamkensis]|uniref:TIGR03619 family F420-dependent LLM class oxidoreductase n=2 Tax=Nocardia gamkensis TaxID=352869 RepID=A0A7X6R298_9NOCA|nr:TIGR03619 family F420-dependent LLM class oxidoreductase [Nocardia gamkensis]
MRRLLLGTGVLLLPYRHPVVLAKRLATIDVLSAGRMRLLTVGLGALPGEARAMGVDFHTRGRRADEAIDVLRLLWSGGREGVDYDGEFYAFDKLCSYPKPLGAKALPIHVGGSSRAAARRAGRRGDGYFAGGMLDDTERELQIELARKAAAEAGRDPAALEYTRWGSADLPVEQVRQLEDRGVTRIVVNLAPGTADEQHDRMSEFAERFDLTRD